MVESFTDLNPELADKWLTVPGDWRRPGVREQYQLSWDPSRRYGQLLPRPSPGEVAAFYDLEAYYTQEKRSVAGDDPFSFSQRVQNKLSWWADKGVNPDKTWWSETLGDVGLRVLEIGCGNGTNLSVLSELGHEVVGVEPDPAALAVVREEGYTAYRGTAEELPFEVLNERFDVVIFMHVLEHCIDPGLALRNATDLLNKGGKILAEVPNNDCLGCARFGELWHWLDVPRHLNFFTEESLKALIMQSGFSVTGTFFRGYCRQFGRSWKKQQAHIASALSVDADKRIAGASYWRYFLETAWAGDQKKYDSVCVLGSLP